MLAGPQLGLDSLARQGANRGFEFGASLLQFVLGLMLLCIFFASLGFFGFLSFIEASLP